MLTWTASGDDWMLGQAASYDLRMSDATIQQINFDDATPVSGLPQPAPAGQQETFTVTDLQPGTYHFAIKALDEAQNPSAFGREAIATVGSTDTTPPADILDLSVVPGSITATSVQLQWHAPGDDGMEGIAAAYDVRMNTEPITDANFGQSTPITEGLSSPSPAGTLETLQVNGLQPLTTYYFAIKTADEVPNWSQLSNPVSATTLSDDVTPPSAIDDLVATAIASDTVRLDWTAPADDGGTEDVVEYDIRYSTSPITDDATFAVATQVSNPPTPATRGSPESIQVSGLQPDTLYYFAIKSADEVPLWSSLSNVATAYTDVSPPAAIGDLAASVVDSTTVELTWTAPGDDGTTGTAAAYDIRYSTTDITDDASFEAATAVQNPPTPQAAGSTETFQVTGLSPDTTYYFAIKAADEVPLWSAISNVATAYTDNTPPAAIGDLAASVVDSTTVELTWTAPADDGSTGAAASAYDIRYSTTAITDDASFEAATAVQNPPSPQSAGSPEAFQVTGLQTGTQYWFALKSSDEAGNWSSLSNVQTATPQ